MPSRNYDVIVVGTGCAGLTAALGLARAGFAVAVVERAVFPGAENGPGGVYFCENLVHSDILGLQGVEGLAWERRLVERGFFGTDGHGLLGFTYRDPSAFRNCYTVLRPLFDLHLAQIALQQGAALFPHSTAESLIRDSGRVIGICTNQGPLYANLVFLAEGNASQLVAKEGYERFQGPREGPTFFQGIQQIIELPEGVIEERFGVGPAEGVAYDILLRNGRLNGNVVPLNMRGFLITNRRSLAVGLVMPAANLKEHFAGDLRLLLEWFENLPALQGWLDEGRRGPFAARLIRAGGARDIPTLIDQGLAIGGEVSAVGLDFPHLNFTGPATAMGLRLAQAAVQIRTVGGGFTRANLRRYFLEPFQRSHYWRDVEFLRRWPSYIPQTQMFFGPNLDLGLGSAYIWTRRRWPLTRWFSWVRMAKWLGGPRLLPRLQEDLGRLGRALRLGSILRPPSWGQLLLDGTINACRDFLGFPRTNLRPAGTIELHFTVAGTAAPPGKPPGWLRRWLGRLTPVMASAASELYTNDATPLRTRLQSAGNLLIRQVNLIDLFRLSFLGLAMGVTAAWQAVWDPFRGLFFGKRPALVRGLYRDYYRAAAQTTDLEPTLVPAGQAREAPPDLLAFLKVHCPRFPPLIQGMEAAAFSLPSLPIPMDPWQSAVEKQGGPLGHQPPITSNGQESETLAHLERLLDVLETKVVEFDAAWTEKSSVISGAEAEHLAMLARYAHQAAIRLVEILKSSLMIQGSGQGINPVAPPFLHLAGELAAKTEESLRRALEGHWAWAAADGRQVRWHHLVGMRRFLLLLKGRVPIIPRLHNLLQPWLKEEEQAPFAADYLARLHPLLESAIPAPPSNVGEQLTPLAGEQDRALREVLARVPLVNPSDLAGTIQAPARKFLLAQLGHLDPSLAFRAAMHLWARDLARLAAPSSPLAGLADRWARAEEWACFALLEPMARVPNKRETFPVPAQATDALLLLGPDRLYAVRADRSGVIKEALVKGELGEFGLVRLEVDPPSLPPGIPVDPDRVRRIWWVLASADLVAIAYGLAVGCPAPQMALARYLLGTLNWSLGPVDFSESSAEQAGLLLAVATEILDPTFGSGISQEEEDSPPTASSEDLILAKFKRGAAWKILGPDTTEALRRHGQNLLRHWREGHKNFDTLSGEAGLFDEVVQRKALQNELDQVRVFRSRLRGLVNTLQPARRSLIFSDSSAAFKLGTAKIEEQLGRQAAHLLVSKALLLRTHARLEKGLPSPREMELVRIWLERALKDIDDLEDLIKGQGRKPPEFLPAPPNQREAKLQTLEKEPDPSDLFPMS